MMWSRGPPTARLYAESYCARGRAGRARLEEGGCQDDEVSAPCWPPYSGSRPAAPRLPAGTRRSPALTYADRRSRSRRRGPADRAGELPGRPRASSPAAPHADGEVHLRRQRPAGPAQQPAGRRRAAGRRVHPPARGGGRTRPARRAQADSPATPRRAVRGQLLRPPGRSSARSTASCTALYFKVANKSVIWYRTDDVRRRRGPAADRPGTDFAHGLRRHWSDAGVTPMVAAGGDGWVLTDWFENAYLRIGGPDKLRRAGPARRSRGPTRRVVRDAAAAGRLLAHPEVRRRRTDAGRCRSPSPSRSPTSSARQPKAAMLFEGDFVASEITKLGQGRRSARAPSSSTGRRSTARRRPW